jgi:hypothetical protein
VDGLLGVALARGDGLLLGWGVGSLRVLRQLRINLR